MDQPWDDDDSRSGEWQANKSWPAVWEPLPTCYVRMGVRHRFRDHTHTHSGILAVPVCPTSYDSRIPLSTCGRKGGNRMLVKGPDGICFLHANITAGSKRERTFQSLVPKIKDHCRLENIAQDNTCRSGCRMEENQTSIAMYEVRGEIRNGNFCVGDNRDNAFVTRRMENNKGMRGDGQSYHSEMIEILVRGNRMAARVLYGLPITRTSRTCAVGCGKSYYSHLRTVGT
ncbi:hypothetical protein EAG_16173 [Camponotus floridanus]|uniref:Uncharacterized protein n=1 Tax=Camponotus floridanus TaxID=104421 RepID=E2A1B4_CAMFO|nr:hypothetical protein EAG_16173 [Camponotus floridanus]